MLFWPTVAVIVVSSLYFDFQKTKLKQKNSIRNFEDLKGEIHRLTLENQSIKERLQNVEKVMIEEHKKIQLDYEKEQVKIDRQYKFVDDTTF